jgi:hypothetical protein
VTLVTLRRINPFTRTHTRNRDLPQLRHLRHLSAERLP